jgi:phosphoenolpyruvate phosphomutase
MEVAVPMCADFLHPGHVNLLNKAAKHGKCTVWLMSDEAMVSYKRKPFFTYEDRKIVVEALRDVHNVLRIDGHPNTFPSLVRKYKPRVFVHGTDWCKPDSVQAGARNSVLVALKEYGGKLVEPEYTSNVSSTMIHSHMQTQIVEENLKNV